MGLRSLCSFSLRVVVIVTSLALVLVILFALLRPGDEAAEAVAVNTTHAAAVLTNLCSSFHDGAISGDLCNRLCYFDNITLVEFYAQKKVVAVLLMGGQKVVLKSQNDYYYDFKPLPIGLSESKFLDLVVEKVNYKMELDWPRDRINQLLHLIWPLYFRTGELSAADFTSLWALVNQDEYLTYTILNTASIFPRVTGTCGHFYAVEQLVPFKLETILYSNVKSKVLVHLMGTLKILADFGSEPLHWCDARFENLGLSASYPKRFLLLDADQLFTDYRLQALLARRSCLADADCTLGDCLGACDLAIGRCANRTNANVDVFCEKFVLRLFGSFWTKNNRYLAVCHAPPGTTVDQRLNDLRSVWAFSLADV